MAVTWNPKPPEGKVVADRDLYLDATGNKLVDANEAATQIYAKGHVLDQADIDRLGLVAGKDGKITQDHETTIEGLRKVYEDAQAEQEAFAEEIKAYKEGNAVNDIPNRERIRSRASRRQPRRSRTRTLGSRARREKVSNEWRASSRWPSSRITSETLRPLPMIRYSRS